MTKPLVLGDYINEDGSVGGRVELDPIKLVRNRALITANSGGGKSYAVRRMIELTYGHFPQHILDPEGEFHTLREKFDYVLVGGPGGDRVIHPKHAAHLARRMIELNVSVIMDLSEYGQRDREIFVMNYITGLMELPRVLWRTAMIVIDEAQKYCPEKGEAPALSTEAVLDLMTRGRKRGFCGVLATQRISPLHKSAVAECNNRLIGRTGLDVDLARAANALGYSPKQRDALKHLDPGHFRAFGPAFATGVQCVHISKVITTHPEPGEAPPAPVPPRGKIAKVLAELANLPDEADAEIKGAEEMKAKIASLEKELKVATVTVTQMRDQEARRAREVPSNRTSMAPAPAQLEKALAAARREAAGIAHAQGYRQAEEHLQERLIAALTKASDMVQLGITKMQGAHSQAFQMLAKVVRDETAGRAAKPPKEPTPANGESVTPRTFFLNERHELPATAAADNRGAEQKILDALAWFSTIGVSDPDLTQVAFMAGYSPNTKSFKNARGALRSAGKIEYVGDGRTRLTNAGVAAATLPNVPTTIDAFHQVVLELLPGPSAKLLKELLPRRAEGLETEILADLTGYSPNTKSFKNARGHLRSLGFVEYGGDGTTFATELMYPERT